MRKRMTPPEWYGDWDLAQAFPYPNDYPGRLLERFIQHYCEDSGVFEPNFGNICTLFCPNDPFGPQGVQRWYRKLVDLGRIVEFKARGKTYAWVVRLHTDNDIDHPSAPKLPLPPWVVWHGKDAFDKRSQYHYEILWDMLPSAATPADEPARKAAPDAPGEQVKYGEGTLQYELACDLREAVLSAVPGAAVPPKRPYDLRRWSLVMGLMLEAGATEDDLRKGIGYVAKDPLWIRKIRTADNFRDNWQSISIQMVKGRSPIPGIDKDAVPSSLKKQAELAQKATGGEE